ncbi:MAG: lipid-A-disaccharide synthase [Pirellulales bacterium]|nr:lipid-A-disaccharide synthase [Pirellulales bacterium]
MDSRKPLRIFFSAGEPSGDLHGANLIRRLRERHEGFEAVGYGGPQMAAAGCRLHQDLTSLAVMWFLRVLLNLHRFLELVSRADRYFRHQRPDAVVLIDYPGFNWWIARRAKAHGIPVFYYAPPQVWAWARWRVKKMRRLVDHVLCGLPFEAEWFRQRGCNAVLVGHPFFDEVRRQQPDREFLDGYRRQSGPLVAILPGSRTQEVAGNLATLLKAARRIQAAVPGVCFAIAAFKPRHAEMAQCEVSTSGLPVQIHVGKTPELMQLADCCMAVSGSVSLELLYHTKPTVILYQIGVVAYWIQGVFRKVKYITLVNLLAARNPFFDGGVDNDPQPEQALFPEYLTCEDKSDSIAAQMIQWLTDPQSHSKRIEELTQLKAKVVHGGASGRAAGYILGALAKQPPRISRPHFVPGGVSAQTRQTEEA